MDGRCSSVDRASRFAVHAAGARQRALFHDKPHACGLPGIVHQPVADFVRSPSAAAQRPEIATTVPVDLTAAQRDGGQCPPYDLLAIGRRNDGDKPHARGLSPRGTAPNSSSPSASDTPWRRPAVGCDGGQALSVTEPTEDGLPRTSRNFLAEGAIPGDDWSVAALGLRAQHELARIADDERQVTPAYWLLGKALNAARKHFAKKGTWERWLRERGIGEDRAQKARRLATFFATPGDLAGLSLREALRLAKSGSPKPATAKLLLSFDRRMRNAIQAANVFRRRVESRGERAALARSLSPALAAFGKLHHESTDGETQ